MNLDLFEMVAAIERFKAFMDEIPDVGVSFCKASFQKVQGTCYFCSIIFVIFTIGGSLTYISSQVVDDRIGEVIFSPHGIYLKLG